MVRAQLNPNRLVVELPGREPYILWTDNEIVQFIQETFEAGHKLQRNDEKK
jgi:hypothetical protein